MSDDGAAEARRWTAHMRGGRYAAAWRISDELIRRNRAGDLPRHLQPVWRGKPLNGRNVTIRCYRGLGDTIHFIRYAPLVKAVARQLTVVAQPELLPLLRTMPAIDRLNRLDEDQTKFIADVEVEVTELPHVFRTTVSTVPSQVPYFHVPLVRLRRRRRLAVGIVWASGDWDPRRNVPLCDLAPLFHVPEVTLYSLQRGAAADEARDLGAIALQWKDVVHEAGLLRSLDLLISVDTMPAHLAGALAVPVWLLLHSKPDWRWMLRREDSPWYPTMRLFRQKQAGVWGPVIDRVATELRAL